MLNTFEETFEVTDMRTFKHEPFLIVGGRGGGGAYSWYFTVYECIYSFMCAYMWVMTLRRNNLIWSTPTCSIHWIWSVLCVCAHAINACA